ncbi:prolyl oligopeptidase family serine peptidase [Pelomonas sp. SE-A7]|uniref:alpha/beta hydrolase family protein n=1 Tax=Pelomonas sp. SE-A7 TaxID=3054953 RepID=UPI00259CDAFA|nr:prolyl oligopeptidase family serine peptidase [Pelomonas sp. SE-A7]MDM4768103.1 prolyl oligopeptidase family serine peptidase [Pelomonas sp. SE-A7]
MPRYCAGWKQPAADSPMLMRRALLLLSLLTVLGLAQAQEPAGYMQPSSAIRQVLDAPALPRPLVSPDQQTLALLELRPYPSIEELARPVLRLAGLRFEPGPGTPQPLQVLQRIRLRTISATEASERVIELPPGGSFHSFVWSPDGQRFLLERRLDQSNELWVGEVASGRLRPIAGLKLNDALGQGEQAWLNPQELVLLSVARRGPPPKPTPRPAVQEASGRASPERNYSDLLQSPYDEALFEYHGRSQMVLVNIATGSSREIGEPQLYSSVSSVGAGQYLLTERLVRPFSYDLTWDDFPTVVEVRSRDGRLIKELARMPMRKGVSIDGVLVGPRVFYPAPTKEAAIYWVEALDGGNNNARVPFRDRLMRLDPPFNGEPREVQRMPHRFTQLRFLDDGQQALLTETDRNRAWVRTYLLPLNGAQSKPLFEYAQRERYRHPGFPLMRLLPNGHAVIRSNGQGEIFMLGQGARPKGEQPFIDRLSLRDGASTRIFQSNEAIYEQPLALLEGNRVLMTRESPSEPPNVYLRDGTGLHALTRLSDPTPSLRRIHREFVSFKRADGVEMSFWVNLPPDYKEGERRPTLVWSYPLEFNDPTLAGQVSGPTSRFVRFSGLAPQLLALDGYVVLSDATMPVVGDIRSINDGFVEQITMNARAILDKAESLGYTDPKKVAVGGHSYGAFMVANLLAHTDLFRVGIARSGAYNRTLTPFGFQSERRSLWDARETYLRLSPLIYANQIKEPLLLIHGDADNNSGTVPLQSERLYQALAGLGGTVRFVSLPHESHGYAARESIGHTQWEMSHWLRQHLGEPK